MSVIKEELLAAVKADHDLRLVNVRGIRRYFDSIIAPLAAELTCHVWAEAHEVNFAVAGSAAELAQFFRVMRQNDFVPDSRPKAGDIEFRTKFRHKNGTVFYLAFTSTVCKRVQIGTQMIEQPVYETVCGDDPVPDDLPVEAAPAVAVLEEILF